VRKDSPLVIGAGKGENLIASDVPAILEYTRDVYYLDDREIAVLYRDHVDFFDAEGNPVEKKTVHVEWDVAAAEKGGYEHFMLKEIHEQPKALTDTLRARIKTYATKSINLEEIGFDASWAQARRVVISACGTPGTRRRRQVRVEHFRPNPVDVDIASEFRYRDPIFDPKDIFIITSSRAKRRTRSRHAHGEKTGTKIIAITTSSESTLAREADLVKYTLAGPEIADASTKAFTTHSCAESLALQFGALRGTIDAKQLEGYINALEKIPAQAEKILENKDRPPRFASHISTRPRHSHGRLSTTRSASKARSSSRNQLYPLGGVRRRELKHGPIALVDKDTLVVAICTQKGLLTNGLEHQGSEGARGRPCSSYRTKASPISTRPQTRSSAYRRPSTRSRRFSR
jgi:glucosamine--fructose-6-phosphate aminotransferase (isomerizing)